MSPIDAPKPDQRSSRQSDTPRLDAISLSALLASRLCHDLINPVGALGAGLEVLDDETMDEGMQEAAFDLIRSSAEKSIALLKYARLAYGAAGGHGTEIALEEAEGVLDSIYEWAKADLDWRLPPDHAPKEIVKTILILGLSASECVPRGGTVTISRDGSTYSIVAEGARAMLQDQLIAALDGEIGGGAGEGGSDSGKKNAGNMGGETSMMPKFAPLYVAGLLVRETGGEVSVTISDNKVTMIADFGPISAGVHATALTAG